MLHLGVAHSLIHKNNTHEIYSTLQCFDNMFHVIYAHEWMNDAHVHEMQVQLGKTNTRGVTTLPPYKNLVPRFGLRTICCKNLHKLFVDILSFPTSHHHHRDDSTISYMFSPLYSE